ncbi:DNA polymerase III subunit delta [Marinigracilibium pacificum]|uniref:DNA polymerase III subunit delta n=1 Tax=Marinigracilibium pacificum TaxID=2729599 RepID=A0A848IYL2_9BACT|nr:DNA polymerase III subunit delta [Marinigracilibium pacificum]NMM48411.1 DNA polymerase III subunit delta [Marinigracilibium pacificum]
MAVAPEKIIEELNKGTYHPVYFLQGDEPFYIDMITEYIEKNALEESQRGFNQMVFYGKDVDVNTIITNAGRFPMMSDRQVVIIKEAQDVPDLQKEQGIKLMENYIKNPQPSTILVFAHKHKTLDGRKSLAKSLDKYATLVSVKKLYDNQVPDWIEKYVSGQGYKINQKATIMLSDFIGNDLSRLSNEINKILINLKEGDTIDEDHIQKNVGISKDFNIFELQKALSTRNVVKANRIVQYFAANTKSHPIIPALAVLTGYYSKLLQIHHKQAYSEKAVGGIIKIFNPYVQKEYLSAARNYPPQKVIENLGHLFNADLASKGVGASIEEKELWKELIYKLMH